MYRVWRCVLRLLVSTMLLFVCSYGQVEWPMLMLCRWMLQVYYKCVWVVCLFWWLIHQEFVLLFSFLKRRFSNSSQITTLLLLFVSHKRANERTKTTNKLQLSLARQIIRESAIFEHHSRFSRSRSHFHFSDRFKIILQDELRQKQGVQTYFQRPMYFIFENQGSIPIKVPGVYIM